ncbi:MAG TPA: 2,3-dihydro-2,3-dihydroxybenzoate dehydrogenase [Streptosporangiaceae bacterium]|nr:2,3-dihydro-2,3-dihydroxybenzoate dehydrogenase [Streptosporangiaceae bacterium]
MASRVAIVTGAAGGIGAAVTNGLGMDGVTVAAVDCDAARLRANADRWTGLGLRVEAFPGDVSHRSAVESLVDAVERRLGPVESLVNAAGVLRVGKVTDFAPEDWAEIFSVNTTGVFNMCQAVSARMVPRSRGAIVTVASNAARVPRAEMAAYAASKAAAAMFTKSLGLEVARHGIRCNVVAPGSTDTPMLRSMWHDEADAGSTIDGRPDAFRVGIPLGRLASPNDVSDAVAFLLSDRAAHITLHELTIDGGAALGA